TEYLDDGGPTCYGLDGEPIVPFPVYRDAEDGYRDGQDVDPSTGASQGEPPSGPDGSQTYPEQRPRGSQVSWSGLPLSAATYDRAAVGVAVAPALGVTPAEVPDVAVLLFAPAAR
ncbi:MAG TPA: hypothetical protein VM433_02300, partial [Mycobacteriales bacterium]|nr:hypothetical protein [Mycobacteriales bacterium]